MRLEQQRCPYEVLRIPVKADDKEIRESFRLRALATHPDKGGAAAEFREVVLAFRVLSDPAARREYDQRSLKASKRAAPASSASTQAAKRKHRTDGVNRQSEVEKKCASTRQRVGSQSSQGDTPTSKRQRCSPPSTVKPEPASGVRESSSQAEQHEATADAPQFAEECRGSSQTQSEMGFRRPRKVSQLDAEAATWLSASVPAEAAQGNEESQSTSARPRTSPAAAASAAARGRLSSVMLRDLHSVVRSAPQKERKVLVLSLSHMVRAELLKYLESRCSCGAKEAAEPNGEERRWHDMADHEQPDGVSEAAWRKSRVAELVRLLEASLKSKPTPQATRPSSSHADPSLRQARLAWWRRSDLTMGDLLAGCPI